MNTCIKYVKERKGEGCKMNINSTLKNIIIFKRKIENGEMVRKIDSWLEEQIDTNKYFNRWTQRKRQSEKQTESRLCDRIYIWTGIKKLKI